MFRSSETMCASSLHLIEVVAGQPYAGFSIQGTPVVCVVDAMGRATPARTSQPGDL